MPQVNLDAIKAALAAQESNDGRNPNTYKLNNHKAFGKYQIIEQTFNGMKANGSIPADWVHTNPDHADKAGEKLVEQLHAQYNGDPTKIAAAFYAGPKAVLSDGSIKNYTDKKNPGNPDTLQYVQQVAARLGDEVRTDAPQRSTADYLMNAHMPVHDHVQREPRWQKSVTSVSGVAGNVEPVDLNADVAAQRAPQAARKGVIDNTGFGDSYKAASVYGGLTGAVVRRVLDMATAPDNKPDPAYKRDPAMFEGRTAEEQEELMTATSLQQATYIRAMQDHRRTGEDEMSRAGMAQGLAAGFVADLPANLATGFLAARTLSAVGLGSLALAAQGRTVAAVASHVVENVGAGVLTTGLQDAIDGHVSMEDLATGALFDLGTSMLGVPGTVKESRVYRAAATEAATRRAELVARAHAAVGEGAPTQAVLAEARRMEEAPVREVLAEAQRISADRRLLSEEDNNAVIYGQVPAGANPDGGAVGTQPQPAAYSGLDANGLETYSGTMRAVHGSQQPLSATVSEHALIDNGTERYDGDGGVWGGGFYADLESRWFEGAHNGGRMWELPYASDVDMPFDNALVVRPETLPAFEKLMASDPTLRNEAGGLAEGWRMADFLAGKGYDGIIVRGFDKWSEDPSNFDHPWADLLQDQIVAFNPTGVKVVGQNKVMTPLLDKLRVAREAMLASGGSVKDYELAQRPEYRKGLSAEQTAWADSATTKALYEAVNSARKEIASLNSARVADTSNTFTYAGSDADLEARTKMAQESADKSVTLAQIGKQGDDARVTSYVPDTAPQHVKDAANATIDLAAAYLPDHVRVGVAYMPGQSVAGMAETDGPVVRVSFSDIGTSSNKGMQIAVHEVTHAMNAYYLPNYVNKADLLRDYGNFVATVKAGDLEKAARMRWASKEKPQVDPNSRYDLSFDEWVAEQSAKYANEQAGAGKDVGLRAELAAKLRDWADRILGLFFKGKDKKYIPAAESVKQYVDAVRAREVQPVKFARPVKAQADSGAQASLMNDPIARKYGVDLLPQGDPIESAKAKAILALYKKADGYAKPDEKRLNTLLKNTAFGSTATKMLVSENPVIRMVASELLESATGATKRQATAAIGKYLAERRMLGNSLNQFESLYSDWSRERGGSVLKDTFDGKHWADFNREVAMYIEGAQANAHPAVKAAAEALEKSYDRIRTEQVQARTLGYQGLPETSKGYMPRRMSPAALRNMTVEQQRVLHSSLTDQFIQNEGFDPTFADTLASRYIDTIRKRGVGGHTSSVGEGSADLDIMDAAIDGMNLNAKEAFVLKGKLRAGAAGHTKGRLKLDLVREHTMADGSTFRLLDVFETDQRQLLRQQAARASGEVALAQHGILGKPGLDLLREAASLGDTGSRAQPAELEAFDQVAAEFLAAPFGTNQNRVLDRVGQATSLSRLGSMAFPQLSEYLNGIAHVGIEHTLSAVGGMVRLRNEAKALARGEKVDNPLLSSIETVGGAEFGTENYKFSFPYENPDNVYQTFGKDSVTAVDRMLRGGLHLQSKLSFWRALNAAQERGMAEQIVRKSLRYMREGGNDAALADMGFSADLGTRLGLDTIATWEGGRVVSLDLTKATDTAAAEEFIQAVHRGTKQIIQGTFIGEQGKWVHDGFLKFLGQFRAFSINSTEKQWTRQMNNHGTYKGLGLLLGTMAMSAPVYIARVYLNSVGRDDREEYLDKMLAPGMMARATLNYVAMTGLAGDFVDAFTAVTGTGELTGARTGAASGFVGTVIAPGAGWIDDVWRATQNTEEGTNLEPLAKTLPFANLPYLSLGIRSLVE